MADYKHFDIEQVDDVTLVRLNGQKINGHLLIDELLDDLLSLFADLDPSKVVVNCRGVKWLTSEGIRGLLRARQETQKKKGELRLCELEPLVRNTLEVLKLCGSIFRVYDNEAEALRDFAST